MIDSLIEVGLPKSALKEVIKLNALARKENNVAQIVRATIYNLKFQSYIQENALVSIVRTLKSDIEHSAYPVKPILQSFLADMYWQYYQDNRYQLAGRSKVAKPAIDFRNWDLSSLLDETTKLYKLSLKDAEKEQDTPVSILDGILVGDKNTRFLRPTLYDLLLHRSLTYFMADEPAITKPKLPFTLNNSDFFSDAKTFVNLIIKTTYTAFTAYQGIKFLQQGIKYHLPNKSGQALADLDLKRISFIYTNTTLSNKDSLYIHALERIATDASAGKISADAFLAIGRYDLDLDSLNTSLGYLQQAVDQYPKSLGAIGAANLIHQIYQKDLSATMEDINFPNEPILALLNYRNFITANIKVYAVTEAQLKQLHKRDIERMSAKEIVAFFKNKMPEQNKTFNLPVTMDHRRHSTEFKIDPLKTGAAKGEHAYLISTNNSVGRGDIVKVKLSEAMRPNQFVLIKGKVFDGKTKEPMGANIMYEDLGTNQNVGLAQSDPETGDYQIALPYGIIYSFLAAADQFISVGDNLDLSKADKYAEFKKDLYLVPIQVGSTVRLNNILFDFGKSTLRSSSFSELDPLYSTMQLNSAIEIELGGHTDNVGKDADNLN